MQNPGHNLRIQNVLGFIGQTSLADQGYKFFAGRHFQKSCSGLKESRDQGFEDSSENKNEIVEIKRILKDWKNPFEIKPLNP